jgi:uncharacterized repeat protein (TIGR01451 family)
MKKLNLMKGLLGASALTVLSTGNAFAQNAFTPAGETVSNTFTLNYEVNNTPQTEINNIGTPTEFAVDRLVNVTVSSPGDTFVVSDQEDALLPFVVVNNGNDEQAYLLGIEQVAGDDFNTEAPTTAPDIIFYDESADTNNDGVLSPAERAAATPQEYNTTPGAVNIPVLDADERVFVFVRQNIPDNRPDAEQGGVVLFADTQTITGGTGPSLTFTETLGDADGTNDANPLTVENVLADENGVATDTNDGDTDGAHSARGDFIIEAPNVTATKDVYGVAAATEGTCDPIAAAGSYTPPAASTEYYTPNSCVEYVIQVNNEGSQDATNIDLSDILPDNLTFRQAEIRGDLAGTLSAPTSGDVCDGTASTCTVSVANGTLASGSTGTPTVGYLVIRATID